jgi:hypothetical protein
VADDASLDRYTLGAGMKGKTIFSKSEAARARDLLRRIRAADRDKQKSLRDCLRKEVCFYITDFTKSSAGFTVADFDRLVEQGTITVE